MDFTRNLGLSVINHNKTAFYRLKRLGERWGGGKNANGNMSNTGRPYSVLIFHPFGYTRLIYRARI